MWFGLISLFPEMLQHALSYGVVGRAFEQKIAQVEYFNPRDYADNPSGYIDHAPYGGGAGMVMQPGPLLRAVEAAQKQAPQQAKVVYLSPQGTPFTQTAVMPLLQQEALILIAGRYEGIDQRVIDLAVDEIWSIGDYVLSGGEVPILVMLDALMRQIPGVVGDADSVAFESFQEGLLEHPHYTRPAEYAGLRVPDVLLSGNHEAIRRWRQDQSLRTTKAIRPDLLQKHLVLEETA